MSCLVSLKPVPPSHYAESQGQISVAESSAPVTGQGIASVSVHPEMLRVLIPVKAEGKRWYQRMQKALCDESPTPRYLTCICF